MADCPANTDINTYNVPVMHAEFVQGVVNRLNAYYDKYNVAGIRVAKRISASETKITDSINPLEGIKIASSLIGQAKDKVYSYSNPNVAITQGTDCHVAHVLDHSAEALTPQAVTDRDYLITSIPQLENECWACHTGDTARSCSVCDAVADTCSTWSCTCNATCNGYGACSCNSALYVIWCTCNDVYYQYACTCAGMSYKADAYNCSCVSASYGFSCVACDSVCYDYGGSVGCPSYFWVCNCYLVQHQVDYCTCLGACYGDNGKGACICNSEWYNAQCTCNSHVHELWYCACESTCYAYVACSCNSSCVSGHTHCSCDTTCYEYALNCTQCNVTAY